MHEFNYNNSIKTKTMKKLAVLFAAVCCVMTLSATTYTSHIKVTINGISTEQDQVQVNVTSANGQYNLSLKNFSLTVEGITLPVGNIEVNGVEGVDEYGYTTIRYNQPIMITPGDNPAYSESDWIGPMLGEVPIELTSRFTDTALSANIDIDMTSVLGQVIEVSLFGVAPAEPALDGDVNKDNEVNVADVNAVIDIILNQ